MSETIITSSRPVVVGVGLTDESPYVLRKALGLIKDPARIVALHVKDRISVLSVADPESTMAVEAAQEALNRSTNERLAELCSTYGIEDWRIASGSPASQLQHLAQELDARAIVVGSHGYYGWRAILGETANSVLYDAPCDVLAIMSRDHASEPKTEYKKILVCTDLSDATAEVLRAGLIVRQRYGGEISLLSVIKPLRQVYPGLDTAVLTDPSLTFEHQAETQMTTQLEQLCQENAIEDYQVRHGDLAREVHACVDESGIDLVVMGNHHRHGLKLLTSAAPNEVLHGLTCDLLAVHLQDNS